MNRIPYPCYCGCLDCFGCHPENFKRSRYIGDDDGMNPEDEDEDSRTGHEDWEIDPDMGDH